MRRSWDGLAVFGPRNLAQLHGHGEIGRLIFISVPGLVGWQRLFFGFSLCPNCRLECKAGTVLSGGMFDGRGCGGRFGCGRTSTVESEDYLADFYFVAFFDFYFFD